MLVYSQEREKLTATVDEIHHKIKDLAKQYNMDEKMISAYYHQPEQHQQLAL